MSGRSNGSGNEDKQRVWDVGYTIGGKVAVGSWLMVWDSIFKGGEAARKWLGLM